MVNYYIKPTFSNFEINKKWKLICTGIPLKRKRSEIFYDIFLGLLKFSKFNIIQINLNNTLTLTDEEFDTYKLLVSLFIDIKKIIPKFKCSLNFNQCKISNFINTIFINLDSQNFLKFLEKLLNQEELIKNNNDFPLSCKKCYSDYIKKALGFKKKIKETDFFKYISKKFGSFSVSQDSILNLFPSLKFEENQDPNDLKHCEKAIQLQYSYFNDMFQTEIYKLKEKIEEIYNVKWKITSEVLSKSDTFKNFFRKKISDINIEYFSNIEKKITLLQNQISELIKLFFPEISNQNIPKISLKICLEFLKMEKIFPLLVDPFIEEIFLDSCEDFIYINHQKRGRCRTLIKLSIEEIESLKTHLKLASKMRLDEKITYLNHVINNKFFHCRFTIDVSPSHWKNISIDIRKLNKKVINLIDFIKLNSLNTRMASLLFFCLLYRINITIAGEVNTGKTTLLNALDLFAPPGFRKIYVEESIETLNIPLTNNHQLKFKVEQDFNGKNHKKEEEIYRLLHRSGDYIILGEILNKNETHAMFHCLSTGLRGLQTTHCANLTGLINRWLIHYKIEKDCLNDLGLIILMKKQGQRRIIYSINEIFYDINSKEIQTRIFWKFSPNTSKWNPIIPFPQSKIFNQLKEINPLSEIKFQKLLFEIESFLNREMKQKSRNFYAPIKEVIDKLQKIEKNIGRN